MPQVEFSTYQNNDLLYYPTSLYKRSDVEEIQQATVILDDDVLKCVASDNHCPIIPFFLFTHHFTHGNDFRTGMRPKQRQWAAIILFHGCTL